MRPGVADQPLEVAVERVRDGRSMATRRGTVTQGERPLLVAIASFHANPDESRAGRPAARAPDARRSSRSCRTGCDDLPPDARPARSQPGSTTRPRSTCASAKPPTFLGGPPTDGARSHWMRLPRDVGDDPLLHTALLAYASDYLLLDMAFRSYPERDAARRFPASAWTTRSGSTARSASTAGTSTRRRRSPSRRTAGLSAGTIHDADGHLVASVMQEVLVRPAERPTSFGSPPVP